MIPCGRTRSCLGPAMGGKVQGEVPKRMARCRPLTAAGEWPGQGGARVSSRIDRTVTSSASSGWMMAATGRTLRTPALLFGSTSLLALVALPLLAARADVATDGTLGPRVTLSGADLNVGAELGQTRGRNLFHSFERFNIDTGGRVTFTGPDGIAQRHQPGHRRRALVDRRHPRLGDPRRRFLLAQPRRHPVRPERATRRQGLVPRQHRRPAATSPTARYSARWTRPAARSAWPSRRRSGSWAPMSGGSRSTGSTLLVPAGRGAGPRGG